MPSSLAAAPAAKRRRGVTVPPFSSAASSASMEGHLASGVGFSPRRTILRTRAGTDAPAGASRTVPLRTAAVSPRMFSPANGRSPYSAS